MAFRALLFSKNSDANTAVVAACASVGIHAEVCSDIFTAIEKAKSRAFSCVIADWADQPESSFLIKRARESVPNRETLAVAIVDREPKPAELRDTRLDFLIKCPVSVPNASAVLKLACEKMQPLTAEDARESFAQPSTLPGAPSVGSSPESCHPNAPIPFPETNSAEEEFFLAPSEAEIRDEPRERREGTRFRGVLAVALAITAALCLWQSQAILAYVSRTSGNLGGFQEFMATLFHANKTGVAPVSSAGSEAPEDANLNKEVEPNSPMPALGVVATESTLSEETRIPLRQAPDFPLPRPTVERRELPPMHVERAAIPESMRNSAPIERPIVATVNPAQMMPVSTSQPQPSIQQVNEPVALGEEGARALLIHSVNPVYPPEALPQKLHGPVVLQAVIGRDGSVQDLKIVRGYFVLGKAAIAAVKQWRFQPYIVNGHAASTQTLITVNFNYPPG